MKILMKLGLVGILCAIATLSNAYYCTYTYPGENIPIITKELLSQYEHNLSSNREHGLQNTLWNHPCYND